MGNAERKPADYAVATSYDPTHWNRDFPRSATEIWTNSITQHRAQVYLLPTIPSIQEMNVYQLRTSQPYIVRVLHLATNQNQYICLANSHAQLLIEYIPIRLDGVR